MVYGNKKKNDKIASGTGQDGSADGKRLPARILTPFFTKTFYPASIVCDIGFAAVFKDRLSRYYTNAQGLFRFTQRPGIKEHTTLFDSLLCRGSFVKKRAFEKLLASIFQQSLAIGILNETSVGAIDSTGLETHHISSHFISCTRRPSYYRRTWPKMTAVCDIQTHLIASCIVTRGPGYDFYLFEEAIREAVKQVRFKRVLADGGYDCEANHRAAFEIFGIEAVIKLNLRGFNSQPHGYYRRQMKKNFDKRVYNNRWQIESVFSRHKRLLGSALRNRAEVSRERECLLRVLTHNLMIIRCAA
jgi:hypothetical protein